MQSKRLTDLCFNKKIEQEKKSLYKISITKSIYVDTYYVLFAIIVTECDVSSNEIFFLKSQKGGGIASVNYLNVKDMSPIETHCLRQKPNPRCSKLFVFK